MVRACGMGVLTAGAAVLLLAANGAHGRDLRYRVAAMSGQPAPFGPNLEFFSLSAVAFGPVISQRGEVVSIYGTVEFRPEGPSYAGGMLRELDGVMIAAVTTSQQVPSLEAGTVFITATGNVSLDESGRFLLPATVAGPAMPPNSEQIIYLSAGAGQGSALLRNNDPAPGAPGDVVRSLSDASAANINDLGSSGAAVFQGEILEGNVLDRAVWLTPSAGVSPPELLARAHQPAPDLPAGVVYRSFPMSAVDQSGAGIVHARVGLPSAPFPGSAIYRYQGGATPPRLLARDGAPLPGTAGPSVGSIQSVAVAPGGHLVFAATSAAGTSLWIGPADGNGPFRQVPVVGHVITGSDPQLTFGPITTDRFGVNRRGEAVFIGTVSGEGIDGNNSAAIFSEGPSGAGQPRLLARQGAQAAGSPPGVNIRTMSAQQFGQWCDVAINARGQTAFYAFVTDPDQVVVEPVALYAAGRDGVVHEVARMGAPITLAPGLTRTVRALPLRPTRAYSPTRRWLNDSGELAFIVEFVEGGSALVVASIDPCPGDADGDGEATVLDIFDFLNAWFAGLPRADVDGMDGVNVLDIFAFLQSWFGRCG